MYNDFENIDLQDESMQELSRQESDQVLGGGLVPVAPTPSDVITTNIVTSYLATLGSGFATGLGGTPGTIIANFATAAATAISAAGK
jgi:hypothetical protein